MIKKLIVAILKKLDLKIEKVRSGYLPPDMDEGFENIYRLTSTYTMTSVERAYALYKAIEYVVKNDISGDIVETGVFRGGSMMIASLALQKFGDISRKLYLYDTYEGMVPPGEKDKDVGSQYPAKKKWDEIQKKKEYNEPWFCYAPLEEVKKNMRTTNYPGEKLIFVKGRVEDTVPKVLPGQIALLRIDTDWYSSTKHALMHLFPKLVPGGVLILDDYGHWQGAREAADTYFKESGVKILLHRVDGAGRTAIKKE